MDSLDHLMVPLTKTNIIEANAGCGKTYALTNLYLRFILEEGLTPRNILVVTYTKAGTAELQERIRGRLARALDFSGSSDDDPFLAALLEKCRATLGEREIGARLSSAVSDFDEAAIYTIHGFCHRLLRDFAFECGTIFDFEVQESQEKSIDELLADFFRCKIYKAPSELASYVLATGKDLPRLKKILQTILPNPKITVIPSGESSSADEWEVSRRLYGEALEEILKHWSEDRDRLAALLGGPALKANIYGSKTAQLLARIDGFFTRFGPHFPPPSELIKLTPSALSKATKKGHRPPEDEAFNRLEELINRGQSLKQATEVYWRELTVDLLRTAREKLSRRNLSRQVLSYDDLLQQVRQALQGEGAHVLLQAARRLFRAALIDEFQDTDPIQYEIFQKIFAEGDLPTFYVGDPKQAIYGFRGADVFSYLTAAKYSSRKYTLTENWRSDPRLIQAVNSIFQWRSSPFAIEDISFYPSQPAGRQGSLTLSGENQAPLQIWYLPSESKQKGKVDTLTNSQATDLIARAVAQEIKRLLQAGRRGEATLDGRPLRERDIAVLVRKNREARLMKEALNRLNIRSIIWGVGNVFASFEAQELGYLLCALCQPAEERLMRTALATRFFGFTASLLDRLSADEGMRVDWVEKFHFYHHLWQREGFTVMFRMLMDRERCRVNFLEGEDGERALTNIFHLAELVHQAERELHPGLFGLYRWFIKQCQETDEATGIKQLRLESDEEALKIVTIHKSKGLEYPIVFIPFSWGKVRVEDEVLFFHDGGDDPSFICDLGSDNYSENKHKALREALAEDCRLLYVALTRAKYRCYFVLGRLSPRDFSAITYLLQGENITSSDDSNEPSLAEKEEERYRNLERLVQNSGGTLQLYPIPGDSSSQPLPPSGQEDRPLSCRNFSGQIDHTWQVTSVTLLTSGRAAGRWSDRPDYDEIPSGRGDYGPSDYLKPPLLSLISAEPGPTIPAGIPDLPKGPQIGILLHEILQELDFHQAASEGTRLLIKKKLALFGLPDQWTGQIEDLMQKVVTAPLDGEGLRLSDIKRDFRLDELSFYFPLKRISSSFLKTYLAPYVEDSPYLDNLTDRLHFSPAEGFMRGFIDLVFFARGRYYLVDWKSNYLGDALCNYADNKIKSYMEDSFYIFQYLIYTTALHQYLKLRKPDYCYEEHFGGVFYIFLRGCDPRFTPHYGVYYDRPAGRLIEALAYGLIDHEESGTGTRGGKDG